MGRTLTEIDEDKAMDEREVMRIDEKMKRGDGG